jgi:hypothetical protein
MRRSGRRKRQKRRKWMREDPPSSHVMSALGGKRTFAGPATSLDISRLADAFQVADNVIVHVWYPRFEGRQRATRHPI